MPPKIVSQRPVTIRDLAAASGYSGATVSLALRNSPKISKPVRDLVRKVADDMCYRPNPLMAAHWNTVRARKAVTYQSTIALLHDADSPLWGKSEPWAAEFFTSFRKRAEALGYVIEEIHVGAPLDPERAQKLAQASRVMKARGIPAYAIILCNHPRVFLENASLFEEFAGVFISSQGIASASPKPSLMRHLPFNRVNADRYGNMLLLLDRLHEAGYRRPGFWPNQWSEMQTDGDAAAAFLLWTQRISARDRVPMQTTVWSATGWNSRELFLRWLERKAPDVVVCENYEVRAWLEKAGYKIPRDIGLAHLALGPMEAKWSGINMRRDQIASAAADTLTAHLQRNDRGAPACPEEIKIDGCWVQGETTKKPSRARPTRT